MSSYFSAKGIRKTFDSKTISFDFECDKGTLTSLVGPSGAGKSTVLKIISGLEKNDEGSNPEIILDGKHIEKLPPSAREIGMIFQSGALFDNMNVVQNVAYGLITKGEKKKDALEKASAFLSEFGLAGFEKRNPATLSGGERQRVALARTLITAPKLILMDEPLSALDADLRLKLGDQIKVWQKEFGFTAIMVTHDMAEASRMSDRIFNITGEGN
ncbi:MAG: ABC transporter ATP-binding protein [Treponema sp.]|nr:ABC transporter ATP-binding protein [Treponema sp.]